MDQKPWAIANRDDHETADEAAVSGPLGRLVKAQIDAGTVESDVGKPITPSQPSSRSIEYAEGTAEHGDDREGRSSSTMRTIAGLCAMVFVSLGSAAVFAAPQGTITGLTLSPGTAQTGATVTATVTGSAGPCGAVHINWGDGEAITYATAVLPVKQTHVYKTAGTFDLRAQGMGNCLGEVKARIVITSPPPPPVAPPSPAAPPPPAAPRLTAVALSDPRVPPRTAVGITLEGTGACSVTLDFGDGNTQEIRGTLPTTVRHTYALAGRYAIAATPAPPCAERRLAVLDVGNARAQRITGLQVTMPPDGPPTVRALRILGSGSCAYTVDFGDGNSERREGALPDVVRHNYPAEGRYTAIVTAGAPCSGERRSTFTVGRDRR